MRALRYAWEEAVTSLARGRWTRLHREPDGRVFSQGTPLTVGLFLLLVGGKFAWGTWQYLQHAPPHGGFGEILLMIAAMVAMQAEILWQRARRLAPVPLPLASAQR